MHSHVFSKLGCSENYSFTLYCYGPGCPSVFLLYQFLDLALPSITPHSYTWEVAANSEYISAQEQLQLFPPMHYCVFIFCEFHLPSDCPIIKFIKSFGMFSQSSILSCLASPPHYPINLLDHYGVYWKVYSPNYKVIILKIELDFAVIHSVVQETQSWKH